MIISGLTNVKSLILYIGIPFLVYKQKHNYHIGKRFRREPCRNRTTVVKMPLSETSTKYLGINIDIKRDELLSEQARKVSEDYYCKDKETSPQEGYAREAVVAYCYGDMDLAQRIYDYVSKGWFMYASPVLSNAPKPDEEAKALLLLFLNLYARLT